MEDDFDFVWPNWRKKKLPYLYNVVTKCMFVRDLLHTRCFQYKYAMHTT